MIRAHILQLFMYLYILLYTYYIFYNYLCELITHYIANRNAYMDLRCMSLYMSDNPIDDYSGEHIIATDGDVFRCTECGRVQQTLDAMDMYRCVSVESMLTGEQ